MSEPSSATRDEVTGFFDRQRSSRQYESLKAQTEPLDREAAAILNRELRGDALMIGGIWDFFERGEQVKSLTVLDLSAEMLDAYCPPDARPVVGDVFAHEFEAGSFDSIAFPLMLHHVAQGGWRECVTRLEGAVRRARRWLRPGGRVLVLDYCPHPLWTPVQIAALPVTRRFLRACGQPLVVMHSRRRYERLLSAEVGPCRAHRIDPHGFDYWKWYPVFMSVRWLRMPFAIYPKLHVFCAEAADAR